MAVVTRVRQRPGIAPEEVDMTEPADQVRGNREVASASIEFDTNTGGITDDDAVSVGVHTVRAGG
jgi:hypothetical protein